MRLTIIGAARSGMAAAKLAKERGHEVFLSEFAKEDKFENQIKELKELGIDFEFGQNSEKCLDCDRIITSPGVPPTAPILIEAEKKEIEIVSELEFAWELIDNKTIAITGTNGKTTTTALTEYIFQHSGRKAVAVGNIGKPLSAVVNELEKDTVVIIEASSFQLDRCINFRPDVAIITNISPDHIGYHGSFEKYIEAKWKISSMQNENNFLILNADDEILTKQQIKTKAKILWVSMHSEKWGLFNNNGMMTVKMPEQQKTEGIMMYDQLSLAGVHNAYNSMAAALAARTFEITNEDLRDSLATFAGVEHRLERVRTFMGVEYINDSKATNINATWYALQSYNKPLIWIAGGRGDNNDYSALDEVAAKNVKTIIAIGEEKEAIFNHFCTSHRVIKAQTMEDAVAQASKIAEFDEIVLFTPACKSFDMFMSYEHRGVVFKEIVNSLI